MIKDKDFLLAKCLIENLFSYLKCSEDNKSDSNKDGSKVSNPMVSSDVELKRV